MQDRTILEKLVSISPGMEIWWDSSPTIFGNWRDSMLVKTASSERNPMARKLARMVIPQDPQQQLFRGVTTNPSLSLQAIEDDPVFWQDKAADIIDANPDIDAEGLFWRLYKAVVKRGASMYMPLFEQSAGRLGFVSAQVDPRSCFDTSAMLWQAEELATISPNVMIKIPGTKEGYEVIEQLTARGISTNNTLTFVLSQLIDCAHSVQRGLETAQQNKVDLTRWRSVITHMESRFGDLGELRQHARNVGVELTEGEVRLAELAIFKKAYHHLKENDLPSKLLSCSLRLGPEVNGVQQIWHLQEKTGADIVVTCPPSFIEKLLTFKDRDKVRFEPGRIDEEIPVEVMDKLLRIPYFEKGYAEDGYRREEYNHHPALQKSADGFCEATNKMVTFAQDVLDRHISTGYRPTNHVGRQRERVPATL